MGTHHRKIVAKHSFHGSIPRELKASFPSLGAHPPAQLIVAGQCRYMIGEFSDAQLLKKFGEVPDDLSGL